MKQIIVDNISTTYYITEDGKCYNSITGKFLKGQVNCLHGYFSYNITLPNGKMKRLPAHRLVAIAYIPNPDNKPEVNHIDGNKLNNNVKNLEWCTFKENSIHAVEHNLIKSGEESHRSKLRNEDVLFIRNLYNNQKEKYSTTKLSEQFGVKREAIRLAAIGKSFKNV